MQAPPTSEPDSDYPLINVETYHPHDVLCGRGGGTNNHIGNENWRNLIAANKRLYISLPKRQKMLVAQSIVKAVRSQTPPGRFLSRDSKTKKWNDIGDQKAQDKTSQALREGAPDIREEMREEKRLGIPAGAPGTPASPFNFMANSPLSSIPGAGASAPSNFKSDSDTKAPIGSPEASSTSPYVGSVGGMSPMLGASGGVAASRAAVGGQSPAMMQQPQPPPQQSQRQMMPPQYPSVSPNMMPGQPQTHEQQQSATVKAFVQNSLDRTSPVPQGMSAYSGHQDQHANGDRSSNESSGSEKAKRKAVDSSSDSGSAVGKDGGIYGGVSSTYRGSPATGGDRGGPSPSPNSHSPAPAPQDFAPGRFLPGAPMGHQVEHRLLDDDWDDALTAHTQRIVNGEGEAPSSDPVDASRSKKSGSGGYHSNGPPGHYEGAGRASPHAVSAAAASGNSSVGNTDGPPQSKHDVSARHHPNMFNSEKVDNADMVPPPPRRPTFDSTNPGFDLPLGTIEGLMGEGAAGATGVDADEVNGIFGAVASGGNKKSLIDMSDDEDDDDGDDADLRPEFAQLKKLLTPLNKPAVPQAPGPDLGRDPSYGFTDFSVDDMSMTSMAISRGASQAFPGAPGQNVEMTSLSRDLSLALSDMSLSRGVSQNTDINRLREKIEMEYLTRGHSLALSDFGTGNGRNQSLGLNDFGPGGQPKGTSPSAAAAAAFNEFPGFGNEKDSA